MGAERLFDADVCGDPYPLYRELRAAGPVVASPFGWLVTTWEAVNGVLRDGRFGHDSANAEVPPDESREDRIFRRLFIQQDPPEHTYLRGLVSKAFTPRTVAELRPSIEALVADLIEALPADGEVDLLASFAAPLPVAVISEMLGIPMEDRAAFRQWSEDLVVPEGPAADEPTVQERRLRAGVEFADYLTELVADRRRSPGDDLVSRLVQVADEDGRFGHDDLLATCQLLLFAGHETTVNLIANSVLALLRHPSEMDRLRSNPGLIASAVEEFLRFDGPVHLTARTALEDVGGVAAGDTVILLLGSANRDPERFDNPDVLDLCRPRNQHLGFGVGIHFCLGAPLARLEAQLALPALLAAARLAPTGEPLGWRHSLMLRGLKSLPVHIEKAAS